MFDVPDLRGHLPIKVACPNSLTSIVNKHPDFSIFSYMLNLANLEDLYSDSQANFTIFVPSDDSLKHVDKNVFVNMDRGTARHIIKSSTLKRRIPSSVLMDSPASWLHTQDPPNRLFVTNMNGRIYLNNNINVIHKGMQTYNGIIHDIDNPIWPDMVGTPQYH
jgi:uncharacterized surface protein with fasciclin (FAS1) repeats